MKPCIRCRERKALTEFYAHPQMAGGRLNKCKACCIADEKARRNGPARDRILKYDRKRGLTAAHRARAAEYQKTEACRASVKKTANKWRRNNNDKARAHMTVARAIAAGKLTRQPCEKCGKKRAQAHHDDYSKPLDVRWLCATHHAEHHRLERERKRG